MGTNSNSKNSASDFVESISSRSEAKNEIQATLNAASSINIADTISKEQRASIFFVTFMENISKMKAGYGNNSRINEAMNYLYKNEEVEIVDVKTGEMIKVEGSMLESPSLYAVLSGEKVDIQKVENYSSDRILKTIENQLGENDVSSAISGSIASTTGGIRGSIGRLIEWGESAINGVLAKIIPTIDNSLVNNSFNSIKGVSGGELLVEGAVNVGKELAKASGATAGDAAAVKSYAKLTNSILALDAEADRLNRSPFDITSKNTFLGSIVYKFAISMTKNGTILNKLAILPRVTIGMFNNLMPVTYANDEAESYLSNFGNCETLGNIGAVGSAGCTMAATFDTSTLNDIYNDAGFINFVATNTILENGVRKVKNNSMLMNFILYNDERITPVGVVDGGILESLTKKYGTITFVNNILDMVKTSLNIDEDQKKIASGEMFVNSETNQEWENYKYAQRYVSLARAQESLRQFDGNETAYSDLKYFEGTENPVVAFLNDYKLIANN